MTTLLIALAIIAVAAVLTLAIFAVGGRSDE